MNAQALATRPDVLGRALALLARVDDDDAILLDLEQEFIGLLHPDTRRLSDDERLDWMKGLLDETRSLTLRDLWQGGSEDGDAN